MNFFNQIIFQIFILFDLATFPMATAKVPSGYKYPWLGSTEIQNNSAIKQPLDISDVLNSESMDTLQCDFYTVDPTENQQYSLQLSVASEMFSSLVHQTLKSRGMLKQVLAKRFLTSNEPERVKT